VTYMRIQGNANKGKIAGKNGSRSSNSTYTRDKKGKASLLLDRSDTHPNKITKLKR